MGLIFSMDMDSPVNFSLKASEGDSFAIKL